MDLPVGRISNVDVDHQKMEFLWGRWEIVELTWKYRIKPVSDCIYQACTWLRIPSLYLAPYTSKKQSVKMMKSCKSIPDGFTRRKDTQCRFGPWVDWILVGEMLANRFPINSPARKIPSVNLDYQQIRFWWKRWETNELTWRFCIKPVSGIDSWWIRPQEGYLM